MNVVVNGRVHEVPDGCSTARLLELLDLPTSGVAVALDGDVLPRAQWDLVLAAGATVEVLTAVQGG